jgi:hypothetical protein
MRQQRRNLVTSGGLDPGMLPNLELRLSGATLSGAADDPIASWADTSGHGRHATQAVSGNRPYISGINANNPNSPTGRLGAGFNYSHPDYFGGAMPNVGVTAGNTFYLWFFTSPFGVNGQVLYQDQGGGSPQLILSDASGGKVGWRDSGTHLSTLGISGVGAYHSLVYVFAPPSGGTGVGTIYHNGTSVYTATWDYTTAGNTDYLIGVNQVLNVPFAGILYEIDYFSAEHSPGTVAGVLAYGTGFWGF